MWGGECGNVFDGEGEVGLLGLGCEKVAEEEGDGSLKERLFEYCGKVVEVMFYLSSCVAVLPMLSFKTSGLYQTWSLRRKNNFPASRTMRGKVTRPTHHQESMNLKVSHPVTVEGLRGFDVEKILATSLGWSFEELKVMVLSTGPFAFRLEEKGSRATSE